MQTTIAVKLRKNSVRVSIKLSFCVLMMVLTSLAIFGQQQFYLTEPRNAVEYDALYNRAVQLYKIGQHEEAIVAFQLVLQFNPKDDDAFFYLARAYDETGQHQKAIIAYREAIKLKPYNARLRSYICASLIDVGRFWEANDSCREAIRLEPTNPEHYLKFGLAHMGLRNYEGAAKAFELALQLNPDFIEARRRLASAYNKLGRDKEAIEALKSLLQLDPLNVYHREALAELATNLEASVHDRQSGSDSQFYYSLAGAFRLLAQFQKAIKFYTRALDLEPENAQIECDLGLTYYMSGQYTDAEKAYKRALMNNHHSTVAQSKLSWIRQLLFKKSQK